MPENKQHIIYLPKWFPNKYDIQSGSFILKHAEAASDFCQISVVFPLFSQEPQDEIYLSEETEMNRVSIYTLYIRKSTFWPGVLGKLCDAYRYYRAFMLGYRQACIKKGRPRFIHVNVLLRTGVVALAMKLTHRLPYVITEHWSGYVNGDFQKKNLLYRFLSKIVVRQSSGLSAVSDFLKQGIIKCGINKDISVIPDVIEKPAGNPGLLNKDEKIIMLSVADLVDRVKNISGVIHAISKLKDEFPDLQYHIIGDGPDKMALMNMASGKGLLNTRVFFHGRKSSQEVYDYYPSCDFVVVNSNYETFSMITAEALVHNKPVIATRCGGPEQFTNPYNSILVNPGDQDELEIAIRQMVIHIDKFRDKDFAGYILENYSKENVGAMLERFYNESV